MELIFFIGVEIYCVDCILIENGSLLNSVSIKEMDGLLLEFLL